MEMAPLWAQASHGTSAKTAAEVELSASKLKYAMKVAAVLEKTPALPHDGHVVPSRVLVHLSVKVLLKALHPLALEAG